MYDIFYGVLLLFEVVITVSNGLFIIRRDPSKRLNQVFLLVMVFFASYLFFESIIYLLGIVDLLLIDFFRDISVLSSTTSAVLLLFSALIVQSGDEIVEKRLNQLMGFLTIVILVLVGIPFDWASIVENGVSYVVFKNDIIGKIALIIIPSLMVVFAMVQYMRIRQSSEDPVMRQKLLRLTIGLLLILGGIAYFAIFPLFRYPGHVSYIIGLLFMFWAFK
ncbi:MAG: hypothetical protein ACFFC7_32465 [Candidatus Hermodarchaeota archaeon]